MSEITHQDLSPVQLSSLELLRLVDGICRENKLTYSLIKSALIGIKYYNGFLPTVPTFSLAMPYLDYERFVEKFEEKYTSSDLYSLLTPDNCEQFNVLYTRLIKKSRVALPKGRENDEVYYAYFLDIYPLYYAGETKADYKNAVKIMRRYLKIIHAYKPIPETFRFRLKSIITRIKKIYYYKKRQTNDFFELTEHVTKITQPSKYVVFHRNNKVKGSVELLETYTNVVPYTFCGVNTFIPADIDAWINGFFTKKYIKRQLDTPPNQASLSGPEILRRVQLVELEMLVEFDMICRKHNIRYSLFAGTLLGAVRHKGFVPWDDDVDVVMLYDDYLKFIDIAGKELDKEKYFLRTQETDKDNNLCFTQIKRNGTLFKRANRDMYDTHNGIFIDIMPLFNGAENRFIHRLHAYISRRYRTATWAHMGAIGERKLLRRMYYTILAKPSNKVNYSKFIKYATIFKRETGLISHLCFGKRAPYKKAYGLKNIFYNLTDIEFEGHKFLVFSNYEDILSYAYSDDYMRYPTPPRRFAKHLPGSIDLGQLYEY